MIEDRQIYTLLYIFNTFLNLSFTIQDLSLNCITKCDKQFPFIKNKHKKFKKMIRSMDSSSYSTRCPVKDDVHMGTTKKGQKYIECF